MILYSTSTLAALFVSSSTINIGIPTLRLRFPNRGTFHTNTTARQFLCVKTTRCIQQLRVFLNGQNMWLPLMYGTHAGLDDQNDLSDWGTFLSARFLVPWNRGGSMEPSFLDACSIWFHCARFCSIWGVPWNQSGSSVPSNALFPFISTYSSRFHQSILKP